MIALQTQLAAATDPYAAYGVHNHAIMVPGGALRAGAQIDHDGLSSTLPIDITPRLFVDQSVNNIRDQLDGWVVNVEAANLWFDAATFTGFIILDIEHPFKPVEFRAWYNPAGEGPDDHLFDGMPTDPMDPDWDDWADFRDDDDNFILFDHVLEGFSRRVRAARLEFPLAKLAVFPMVSTTSRGNCSEELEENVQAWEYASMSRNDVPRYNNNNVLIERNSWLDELNYVCVQLYPRFAECNNVNLYNEDMTTDFVHLGMEVGRRIANLEANMGVLPVLAFELSGDATEGYTADEAGCDQGRPAHLEYLQWQVAALRDYAFTAESGYTIVDAPICFWDGDGLLSFNDPLKLRPGEPQTIEEFLGALFDVCDLNGVGDDGGFWDPDPPFSDTAQPTNPFDMVFDINGDRYITSADETLYWQACP